MAVIDPDGLFNGRRLRRCSSAARLLWPYLFLSSDGYARTELDYDSISYSFASFGAAAPTAAEIEAHFREFEKNHLILLYDAEGRGRWGQWDTRRSQLKQFKTATDKRSPVPPEPAYSRWLQEQHGGDWRAFHWNGEADHDSVPAPDGGVKFSRDLRNSSATLDQALQKSSPNVVEDFRLGGGVGEGVGLGGDGIGGGDDNHPPQPEILLDGDQGAPANATPPELVNGLLERLGIPSNNTIFRAVAESIRTKAISTSTTATDAANAILLKAALAKKEGIRKPWRFWFEDQEYDKRSKTEATHDFVARHSEDPN